MGEFEYIRWLRDRTPAGGRVEIGIGDDAAALRLAGDRSTLIACDVLLEGRHFRLGETAPELIGRKALAVNLSDIAAMAGRPVAAVVGVALPTRGTRRLAEGLSLGMRELAAEFDCPLVGGDTNTWDGPLVISVTVLGEATSGGPVTRGGAKVSDWLMVTGPLGGSISGRHLTFRPRVAEAIALTEAADVHAMIDISDGLAGDVGHICREGGVGVVIRAEGVPIHEDARRLSAETGRPALEHALSDGEDFELLFCVGPEDGRRLIAGTPIPGVTVSRVGTIVEAGVWIETEGVRDPLTTRGFEHSFGDRGH